MPRHKRAGDFAKEAVLAKSPTAQTDRSKRRTHVYDHETMLKVAKWYYDKDWLKTKIQKQLEAESGQEVEIRAVTRILEQARSRGIVQISFSDPKPESTLERELRERFKLHKVITVPTLPDEPYGDLVKRWAQRAAAYFDELAAEGDPLHVGISGGGTQLAFANAVRERPRKNVHIYTTAFIGRGRFNESTSHIDPLVNATILAMKCGNQPGQCHYATVPPYNRQDRREIDAELDRLVEARPISDILHEMRLHMNLAFVGIGHILSPANYSGSRDHMTMTGLLNTIVDPRALADDGAFGDISCCIFDRAGQSKDRWRYFLTAGDGDLDPTKRGIGFFRSIIRDPKRMGKVVVMAGAYKRNLLPVVLQAGLCNVLITDEDAARYVLRG